MKSEPIVCLRHRYRPPIESGQDATPPQSYAWILGDPDPEVLSSSYRIRAADLGAAQQQSRRLRPTADDAPFLIEIEVLVDSTAAAARRELARIQASDTSRGLGSPVGGINYVGTVDGLAGLIADIRAVGIADGAVLVPMSAHPTQDLIIRCLASSLACRIHRNS